jgi:cytoskeletal protein RodZ
MLIKQKSSNRKKIILIVAVVLLLVAGVILYLAQTRTTTNTSPSSTGSTQKSKTTTKDSSNSSGSISTPKDSNTTNTPPPQPSSSVTPQIPTGTFVSNHHPNLGGSPAPNEMDSTCTTTAGAYCKITFTNNGAVLSLPSKQADANGNVSWTWKLQDIGLIKGSWTVTAIATNGDKTSSVADPMPLEVQP